MLAYYGTVISEHITKKPNGGIICTCVPVARTGTQEYFARELQLDGDPERVIQVTREPDEVFSPAALASFEGCAVTDGHPPESVTAENFSAYVRGHAQNVRRSGDYVVADLHIDDASLASDVLNHVKREVSCGYLCTYAPAGGGYTQKGILGNHIAIVPRGRAGGSVSIKDAAQEAGKGRKYMSKFTEAILSAFGMAAKEAKTQEEVSALVATTATVLDADPSSAAAPEPAAAKPVSDAAAEAPAWAVELNGKLDKVLAAQDAQKVGDEKPSGEKDMLSGQMAQHFATDSGGGDDSPKMWEHWKEDSSVTPVGADFVTILANNKEYASYVNDGHRLDKHFVPGLYIDPETGLLSRDLERKCGLLVGTKTTYVEGLHITDKAIDKYDEVVRSELNKLEREMEQ